MILSESIKPISYVKSHASEVIAEITTSHNPVVITQNGEAKVILEDIKEYEKTQESLAMLKIVAQGKKDMADGNFKEAKQAFRDIKSIIKERKRSS